MATIEELEATRRANQVTRREIERRLPCSYSWLRTLENGYRGACLPRWTKLYEEALEAAIKNRKKCSGKSG